MKKISQHQIDVVLQALYQTNIPAKEFDAIKEFFDKLPVVEISNKVSKKNVPPNKDAGK